MSNKINQSAGLPSTKIRPTENEKKAWYDQIGNRGKDSSGREVNPLSKTGPQKKVDSVREKNHSFDEQSQLPRDQMFSRLSRGVGSKEESSNIQDLRALLGASLGKQQASERGKPKPRAQSQYSGSKVRQLPGEEYRNLEWVKAPSTKSFNKDFKNYLEDTGSTSPKGPINCAEAVCFLGIKSGALNKQTILQQLAHSQKRAPGLKESDFLIEHVLGGTREGVESLKGDERLEKSWERVPIGTPVFFDGDQHVVVYAGFDGEVIFYSHWMHPEDPGAGLRRVTLSALREAPDMSDTSLTYSTSKNMLRL